MAVAGVATGAVAAAAASTVATPYPATVAAGALALCFGQTGNGADPTPPAGWTLPPGGTCSVGSTGTDVGATKGYVMYRFCDGTEGGTSVNMPWVVGHVIARIRTYSGHDTTTPLTFSTENSSAVAGTTISTNSIAAKTNDANDLFLAFSAHDRDSTVSSGLSGGDFANLTGETTTTPVVNNTNLAGGGGIYVFEGDPASDSTGAVSHSFTGATSTIWASLLIRINASGSMGGGADITGATASTEDADTASSSGSVRISATGASTDANDTTSASGSVRVTGSAASTEGTDTSAASGAVRVTGQVASTEASDTAAATGGSTSAGITGTASSTEASDTGSSVGKVRITAIGASSEASDVAAATGQVTGTGEVWTKVPPNASSWAPQASPSGSWTPGSPSTQNWPATAPSTGTWTVRNPSTVTWH